MDLWIVFALACPLFWALSNIVDKVAVDHAIETPAQFMFLLSQFYTVVFVAYAGLLWNGSAFAPLAVVAGVLLFVLYYFYAVVLADEDLTSIIAIHQAEPVFVLALVVLIYQILPSFREIIGFLLVMGGIYWFTAARRNATGETAMPLIRSRSAGILLLSAFVGACATIVSDVALTDIGVIDMVGQSAMGYGLAGLLLLGKKSYRRGAFHAGQYGIARKAALVGLTGVFDLLGYACFYAALYLSTKPALVSVITSIHPIYVFFLTALLAFHLPTIMKENNSGRRLVQKLAGCVIVVAGVMALV